jgi:hypothetical protein
LNKVTKYFKLFLLQIGGICQVTRGESGHDILSLTARFRTASSLSRDCHRFQEKITMDIREQSLLIECRWILTTLRKR